MALAHRSWLRIPDRRTLLGIGLAAAAALLMIVVTRPGPSTEILIGSDDLGAGRPLADLEIGTRAVADATGLVPATRLPEIADWVLGRRLVAGEPIPASLLEPPEVHAASSLMALELEAGHAVLGQISAGDLVDIYATTRPVLGEAPVTELIAGDVFVVEAEVAETTIGHRAVRLLLAVDDDLADRLASAIHGSDLDLVRVQQ